MRIKTLFVLFWLLFNTFSFLYGQSWLWVKHGSTNSPGQNEGSAIATDKAGNVYMTGCFQDTMTFDYITLRSLSADMYLIKYDQLGNLKWAKQVTLLKPNSKSGGTSIAVDTSGNVYVTGTFSDSISLGKDTLYTDSAFYKSTQALFIAKYSPSGSLIWDQQSFPREEYCYYPSITTDSKNNLYVTGFFADSLKLGNLLLTDSANFEIFLIKCNANGIPLWVRKSEILSTIGTYGVYVSASSIATDFNGNVIIGGVISYCSVKFGSTMLQTTTNGQFIVVKYDSVGNVIWAKQSQSTTGGESIEQIATDRTGNIYITGSGGGSVTYDTIDLQNNGLWNNFFLIKINPSGHSIWVKQNSVNFPISEGLSGWFGYAVSTDIFNNVYVAEEGESYNIYYPSPPFYYLYIDTNAFNINNYSGSANLILKFDSTGHLLCSSTINGIDGRDNDNNDHGATLIANSSTGLNVYLGGGSIATGDSLLFGDDTLRFTPENNAMPFLGRWQPCCQHKINSARNSMNICEGSSITLTAPSASTYNWSNNFTSNSITVEPETDTAYNVILNNRECFSVDSFYINVSRVPVITLCCDSLILYGQQVQLIAGSGTYYSWSPSTGLNCDSCPDPIATPTNTTTYTLTITGDSGCSVSKTVTIDVDCMIFVPNAFSPNKDGQNDVLYVRSTCIKDIEFSIFDRWGNRVFESENINHGWDGTHNGQPMNTGTYAYYLTATLYDGSTVEKKGNVALVR